MKKILAIFLLFCFADVSVLAIDFDSSIDESIRQEYNVEDYNLPALPSSTPTAVNEKSVSSSASVPIYSPTGKIYILKRGTQIDLSSKSAISDWQKKGSKVSFSASHGVTTKEGAIIPAGTIFKGTITNSHTPSLTGNGGLIELKIDEIYYNGLMSKIESKVSLANSKKVFFSNIKGKRSYWKNYSKAMTPGRKVFGAAQSCAAIMAPIPVVNILAIVPLACGAVVYTVNFIAAPVIAIFSKGGSLSLPSGTRFRIKITGDTEIKG